MNLVAVTMLITIGFLEPSFADHNDATESKFLTIGEVSKIDVKNKSITIDYATSYNIEQIANLEMTPEHAEAVQAEVGPHVEVVVEVAGVAVVAAPRRVQREEHPLRFRRNTK
jgi:hypothetical protein